MFADSALAQGELTQEEYNAFIEAVDSKDPDLLRAFLRNYPNSILIDAITSEWLANDQSIELPSGVGGISITAPAPAVVIGQGTGNNSFGESESSSSNGNQIY